MKGHFLITFCAFVISPIISQISEIPTEPSNSSSTANATTTLITSTSQAVPTSQPPTTEASPTPERTELQPNVDLGLCTCDLTENACDVRCCCDVDCTDADRESFTDCIEQQFIVDENVCIQSSVVFLYNIPTPVDTSNPSLFCVSQDNYQDRNYYLIPDEVATQEAFDVLAVQYGGHSYTEIAVTNETYEFSNVSKSGDVVYTIYETLSLGKLGLPKKMLTEECDDSNPAAYLYDETSECLRVLSDLASQCESLPSLSSRSFAYGFKVVSTPQFLQENPLPDLRLINNSFTSPLPSSSTPTPTPSSNTTGGTGTDLPPTVLPDESNLYYDNPYLVGVTVLQPRCRTQFGITADCDFSADMLPFPYYNESAETCENVILETSYIITHNATVGIMDAEVEVTLGTITSSSLTFAQKFSVSFVKYDEINVFQRSGNPGYVIGQPLLAGERVEQQVDADGNIKETILLQNDRSNWMTIVKSSVDGTCVTDADLRASVTFGEDMRSGCLVKVSFKNITEVCQLIQNQILNALRGNIPSDYYVAMFGNSPVEKFGDWVPVLQEDILGSVLSPERGTCSNMVTGLHIEVIYANVGSLANPQAKVIGVRYNYADGKRIQYQCLGPFCQAGAENLVQNFEISSSVSFIDASSYPQAVIAEVPPWESELPKDFFYPFTGSSV